MPTSFVLQRLHSLTGVVPLGVFLFLHYYMQAHVLGPEGIRDYNEALQEFRSIPFLILIEIFFLYLPLLYHALYGFVRMHQGKTNLFHYGYGANIRYSLQRLTSVMVVIFIGYHVYTTRVQPSSLGTTADYLWMVQLLAAPWQMAFYLVGTLAVLFYFVQGLWSFCITWGITVSPSSQRRCWMACLGLFGILSVLNLLVLMRFAYHYQQAPMWLETIFEFIRENLFR